MVNKVQYIVYKGIYIIDKVLSIVDKVRIHSRQGSDTKYTRFYT